MQDRISALRARGPATDDRAPGAATIAARVASAAADDGLFVEDLDAQAAAAFAAPWRDLAAHSLEPNAYFEPDFVLPSAAGAGKRLRFLFVWKAERRELLAVCPVVLPRLPVPLGLAHMFTHKNMTCAMPLIDAADAERAWMQILRWLRSQAACGLAMAGARMDATAADGADTALHGRFDRAVLDCASDAAPFRPVGRKSLLKSRRRLDRLGVVTFQLLGEPEAIRDALEAFLSLEASGWKGARGALGSRPELMAFARATVNGLAAQGRCRIASLLLDGTPIAMGIVLVSGRRAFFWKIAYDEALARYSPGALLTLELTDRLLADPAIDVADSCADADHPMIDKLWPGRQPIATLFVRTGSRPAFRIAVAIDVLRLVARERLKRLVQRIDRLRRRGIATEGA